MAPKVRFAPSPTGHLHLGNAYIAAANWLFARVQGGHFLLRLDDTDTERSSSEYEESILASLAWLGLDYDSQARQSERVALYDAARDALLASGRLYPAYDTPEELELKRKVQSMRGLPPVYDRSALDLSEAQKAELEAEGRRPHYRFKLAPGEVRWDDLIQGEKSIDAAHQSDPVLIREDGRPLYTLSSVVDDADLGITHIIRGGDHITNTLVQIQLFEALGAAVPTFGHLPLLADKDGSKLSKRLDSLSLRSLEAEGTHEPLAVLAFLAALGTSHAAEPVDSLKELVANFALNKFSSGSPRLDMDELASLNAKFVHRLPYAAVQDRVGGLDASAWELVRENLDTVPQAEQWRAILEGELATGLAQRVEPEDMDFVRASLTHLPAGELNPESWGVWTQALKAETGRKGKGLFRPLRLALTGEERGPEMAAILPLMGRERVVSRLSA